MFSIFLVTCLLLLLYYMLFLFNCCLAKNHLWMISAKRCCTKWKITSFSGSTPVRRLLCTKPPRKFVQISFAQKLQFICHIFSLTLKAHVHSVTHGQLWKPQHTSRVSSAKRTLRWIGHSGSFKVILIGVSRNSERNLVIMYNNVDIISETYEDIASGKLQIRRFQPPHSGLTTVIWGTLSNIQK